MSIQYMDNFQIYGTSLTALNAGTPWFNTSAGSSALVTDPDPSASGRVFRVGNAVSTQPSFAVPTATDEPRLCWRWWVGGLDPTSGGNSAVYLSAANGDIQYCLHMMPNGAIRLLHVDGSQGTRMDSYALPVVFLTGPVISTDAWQHFEWYSNFTTGAYELRLEGVVIASGTDSNGAVGGDCGLVAFRANGLAGESQPSELPHIKDFIFADANGSVNNGEIGTVQVVTLTPDSDVSSGWTPSTGTSDYEMVDELVPDDADYIQAEDDPLPAASIMGLSNLPPDVVAIRALQTMVRANKSDGGDAFLTVSVKSNGSDDDGANQAVLTSPSYIWDVSELDPDGGVAWTPAKVDAAEIQIDRTA